MKNRILTLLLICSTLLIPEIVYSQSDDFEAPLLFFNRGKLWHSLYKGKSGPGSFNNWGKTGVSWDWPGFDETKIKQNIGGSPSYLASGGMYIGCKKSNDSVLAFEDWAMYAPSVSNEFTAKYILKKHKKYIDNYGCVKSNTRGEEVIETVWEYNPQYPNTYEPERQIPIRVKRTAHQWNGSMREENYIIYRYVISNIANELTQYKESRKIVDTLYGFYTMMSYAMNANSRSWRIFYPNLTPGARNTKFAVDTAKKDFHTNQNRKMIYSWAGPYFDSETNNSIDIAFGKSYTMGQKIKNPKTGVVEISGEWLAPAYAGFRLLYSSPDKISKQATKINKIGWSASDNNQDLGGAITGKTGVFESAYSVLKDPANAYNYVESEKNPLMGQRRLWTLMSIGPWDLAPGDSIVIAIAEIVDGSDYSKATGKTMYPLSSSQLISNEGRINFENSSDKAQFTYDHNMNHPDPPIAPGFQVNFVKGISNFVANQISWSDSTESIPDPDDNTLDLAGYKLYRSDFLPIGPFTKIADIKKKDLNYFNNGKYVFIDSSVDIGTSYYYALTAYDSGKTVWNIDPTAKFKETNSNKVPSLESSVYANRTTIPFIATLEPPKDLNNVMVVPNPFIIGEGSTQPGDQDVIQFVNIPNPCTIKIFNVRGDLIKLLTADESTGAIISWNQATDYGQFVQSGVYIYVVESPVGKKIGKFSIIR